MVCLQVVLLSCRGPCSIALGFRVQDVEVLVQVVRSLARSAHCTTGSRFQASLYIMGFCCLASWHAVLCVQVRRDYREGPRNINAVSRCPLRCSHLAAGVYLCIPELVQDDFEEVGPVPLAGALVLTWSSPQGWADI